MHIYSKRLSEMTITKPLFYSFSEDFQRTIDALKAEINEEELKRREERRNKFTVIK